MCVCVCTCVRAYVIEPEDWDEAQPETIPVRAYVCVYVRVCEESHPGKNAGCGAAHAGVDVTAPPDPENWSPYTLTRASQS